MQQNNSIITNRERVGNFTSSEIVALMKKGRGLYGFGAEAITYINERNMERRLGRSVGNDSNARPLSWGKLCEKRVFDLLGLEYRLASNVTLTHPEIDFWSGSPDVTRQILDFNFDGDVIRVVGDIKCPQTLKSFCIFADCGSISEIRANHPDGEKYYWQLISNAVLTDSKMGELIIYLPYLSELEAIREIASMAPVQELYRYYWVVNGQDDELPYLPDGGYYKNMYKFQFTIPEDDKLKLKEQVLTGGKLLQKFYTNGDK